MAKVERYFVNEFSRVCISIVQSIKLFSIVIGGYPWTLNKN